jgi:hypothetical protein
MALTLYMIVQTFSGIFTLSYMFSKDNKEIPGVFYVKKFACFLRG